VAKPLAGGLPLGAILANEQFAAAFTPGLHGTTFGGGPLACCAALEFLNIVDDDHLLRNIRERGQELRAGLEKLAAKFDFIREVRGEGLILGLDLSVDGNAYARAALQRGLIINCTHDHVLRFLPPYIVRAQHVKEFLARLEVVLARTPRPKPEPAKEAKSQPAASPKAMAATR
jgi:acetylornithine/succinyldiaminopimelate/putrescine aminotransferase